MEVALGKSAIDRSAAETQLHELPATDHTMLALRDIGDRPVIGALVDVGDVRPRI
jgi:hypothetical protein